MSCVFSPPLPPLVPVKGLSAGFPVRRIYCVGRNYADHAREMGADPNREPPFFFGKPQDVVVPGGGEVPYPPATEDLHHEVELVVALGKGGREATPEEARTWIYGYAVGIDLTRRDLQSRAKGKGQPWDMAKGFDHSAPVSAIATVSAIGHPEAGRLWLSVNGDLRQEGDLSDMIWGVPEVIAHLSRFVTLAPGDLIFTGTPAGVGPLRPGDRVSCGVQGVGELEVVVV